MPCVKPIFTKTKPRHPLPLPNGNTRLFPNHPSSNARPPASKACVTKAENYIWIPSVFRQFPSWMCLVFRKLPGYSAKFRQIFTSFCSLRNASPNPSIHNAHPPTTRHLSFALQSNPQRKTPLQADPMRVHRSTPTTYCRARKWVLSESSRVRPAPDPGSAQNLLHLPSLRAVKS
jgi:hypothetical protein